MSESKEHKPYIDKEGKYHYFKNGKWYWHWDDDKPEDSVKANMYADNPIDENKSKNIKRINESQLRDIVAESVRKVLSRLNEGGNIYFKDEKGIPHTNAKDSWRGVNGSTFIWHGEWSDPEIWYDGVELNGTDAEDMLWSRYKDYCEENGMEANDDEAFENWANGDEAECVLIDLVNATEGI